jgi:hypothetical protein
MTQTPRLAFFLLGAVLMCVPGLFTVGMRWAFVAFLVAGCVILIVATVKNGGSRPRTALTLLVASNVSFWLSYALWLLRLKFWGPSPKLGIETFAGPVALWLLFFLGFLLYEAVIFLRGLAANQERTTAAIGLVAAIAQVLVTIRIIYRMVQGV